MASIKSASAEKPYVIKVAPGVYTEDSTVVLKDHVDIEGSGQGATIIECACAGTFPGAVLEAVGITAEIRHLTVRNAGGSGEVATGIHTSQIANGSFSMLHVTATATGGTDRSTGVDNDTAASPLMNHVTATATGGNIATGVINYLSSSPLMNDVTATATGATMNLGVHNDAASPTIRNSSIRGATNSILNDGASPSAKVADTMLDGAASGPGFSCVGAYDATFTALSATCT